MVVNRIAHIFNAPTFEDEDKTRTASLLNTILLTMLALAVVYLGVGPIIDPNPLPSLIGDAITIVVYITALVLMHRGWVQLASILFSITLWLMITLVAIGYGGVTTPAFFSYFTGIVVAGLLLSGWSTIGLAGLSIASCLGLLLAEIHGLLPAPVLATTPLAMWWIATVNFFMVALLLFLADQSIRNALMQAHREIDKRKFIEEKLRESETQYRQLMQELPVGVEIFNPDGVLVAVNKSWEKIWNARGDDVVGKYNPLKNETFRKTGIMPLIEQAFAGKQVHISNVEIDPATLDLPGRKRWMEGFAYHVKDKEGQIKSVVLLSQDITDRKLAEEALQKSEARYRTLVEQASDGIFIADSQGRYIDANASGCQMLGYSHQEILQLTMSDLIPDEDLADNPLRIDELLGDETIITEKRLKCKNETLIPVEISAKILPDGQLLGIVRNITERKQAEEMITRFGRILDASRNEIYIFDADTLKFIQVNRGGCENLGYSMAELRHLTPLEIKPEISAEAFAELLDPLRTGEKETIQFTTIHRRKDRSTYPVEAHLQLSAYESVQVFVAIILDITERKQAEEALARSEKHFRSLIENGLDIITILDSNGIIRYESPSVERVLGHKPEELIGRNAFELVHPDDLPAVTKAFSERSQIGGPAPPIEVHFQHKNGSWRVLEAIGSNLLDDPVVAGIVVNSRDITERKQLEQQFFQAQKMEAIGQLTAGIAHDFNNLLTAINGFAELMQFKLPPDDPHQRFLGNILDSGQRATDLVRQLLAFSSKQLIKPQILNLNTTVIELDRMLRRIIGEDIILQARLTPDLREIKVDPTQIEQVIVNLAVNARDAMPDGGQLTIETANILLDDDFVSQHFETRSGEYVLLAVSDTGLGMSEEVKAHIFEPFFTTKEPGKGTGLGLSTVYGIVKQSQGHIWVYSEPGIGTTFKLYLPCTQESKSMASHSEGSGTMPAGNETILLVEDDARVLNLARQVLQDRGYTVLEAKEGQAAVRLATQHPGTIHLLLTDVVMPGMNGKALADELGQKQPRLKTLFMSGYAASAIVHHGVLDPNISFLPKPFSPTALACKVRSVLDS